MWRQCTEYPGAKIASENPIANSEHLYQVALPWRGFAKFVFRQSPNEVWTAFSGMTNKISLALLKLFTRMLSSHNGI